MDRREENLRAVVTTIDVQFHRKQPMDESFCFVTGLRVHFLKGGLQLQQQLIVCLQVVFSCSKDFRSPGQHCYR
ncbi:hypothetical protein WT24_29600 [Burkholderia sp. MSMB1078WGS]|nr:hypothetical protein WT24_29600 [Burkholderia sp. MSMB1078WGS]